MLTDRFSAPLWMTLGEYAFGRVLSATMPGANGESAAAHFRRHGMEHPSSRRCATATRVISRAWCRRCRSPSPASSGVRAIRIGGRTWRVIIGLGHSPEHASLYCAEDRLLISGDMVLPRISTNVSVFDIEPFSNPLQWFLDSLRKFEACDEDTLVLPSHGRPFRKLHVRLRQLDDHHQERLSTLLSACARSPRSARRRSTADVQPHVRHPPDDLRARRGARAPACALVRRRASRSVGDDDVVRFAVRGAA